MVGSDGDSRLLHGARVYLSCPMDCGGSQHSGTDEGGRYRVTHVLEDPV